MSISTTSTTIKPLRIGAAARLLDVSAPWLYKQVESGAVPHYRFGRSIRFDERELLDWAREQRRGQR